MVIFFFKNFGYNKVTCFIVGVGEENKCVEYEGMIVGRAGTLLLCVLAIILFFILSVWFHYCVVAPPLVPNVNIVCTYALAVR